MGKRNAAVWAAAIAEGYVWKAQCASLGARRLLTREK